MGWREKVKRAQKLHRPSLSLSDWSRDGLHAKFPAFLASLDTSLTSCRHRHAADATIPAVLDAPRDSPKRFIEEYEATGTPTIIRGIPRSDHGDRCRWMALDNWELEELEKGPLRDRCFKCGEDDDGKSIKMKLKHFTKYLRKNKDDSPLYIFDSSFDEDKVAKRLLEDYRVPSYFDEDLFHLVGERRRPPYRWFLVGPERSGTTVHVDPLGTSAWNTLLFGRKRWILFRPGTPRHIVKGKGLIGKDEDDEAIHYFMTIVPRIKSKYDVTCYEFTQEAGETVYIPNGWWHAVLNLTHTVGITQNYCSHRNFEAAWVKTRASRKKMAWKWLCQLEHKYPQLARRARELNERDDYVMKYEPVEVQRREKEEEQQQQRRRRRNKAKKDDKRNEAKVDNKHKDSSTTENNKRKTEKRKEQNNHICQTECSDDHHMRKTKRRFVETRYVSPESSVE